MRSRAPANMEVEGSDGGAACGAQASATGGVRAPEARTAVRSGGFGETKSPRRSLARAGQLFPMMSVCRCFARRVKCDGVTQRSKRLWLKSSHFSLLQQRLDPSRVPVVHVVVGCGGFVRQAEEKRQHAIVGGLAADDPGRP